MLSILVKPSCLSVPSKMGVSNMGHRTEPNNTHQLSINDEFGMDIDFTNHTLHFWSNKPEQFDIYLAPLPQLT